MNFSSTMKLATFTSILMILSTFSFAHPAHAYGTSQWQIGFSGNFHVVGQSVNTGFWGWCAFSGSDGSSTVGTTGTTGDCQSTNYFGKTSGGLNSPVHASFDGPWMIENGSAFCGPPTAPPTTPCFFFTPNAGGTVEVTGPGAALIGAPTGVPVPLDSTPLGICAPIFHNGAPVYPSPPYSPIAGTPCDLGFPAIAGHISVTGTMPGPGGITISAHIEIQVTQIP